MAVFSKELCSKKLNTWLAAEEAVATGQSYQIGGRNRLYHFVPRDV